MVCSDDGISKIYSERTYEWIKENRNSESIISKYTVLYN